MYSRNDHQLIGYSYATSHFVYTAVQFLSERIKFSSNFAKACVSRLCSKLANVQNKLDATGLL